MFIKKSYGDKIKNIFRKNQLNDLIFFVTSKCNSRCHTCFYWRNLNKNGDLTLAEISRISKTMSVFNSLLISGGEPFLREDLPEIVELFYKNNQIKSVGIPTNGLLPGKIMVATKKILEKLPAEVMVSINFSLDGLAPTHDKIRGVSGNFGKSLKGIKKLCALRSSFPNLEVRINTVICKDNFDQVLPLAKFVLDNLVVDGHYFELIRGNVPDKKILSVPKKQLKALYEDLLVIQSKLFLKKHGTKNLIYRQLNHLIYLSRLIFEYRTQLDNYLYGKKWPMPCLAGRTMLVLGPQGELSACELRGNIANIKDFNYDFGKFWHSVILKKEREKIAQAGCNCTHVCFIDTSFVHSPGLVFIELPRLFFKYKLTRKI